MLPTVTDRPPLLAFGPASRRTRWTVIGVAAVLAGVLVAATLSSWRSAHELSTIVNRGHGAMIFHAYHREVPRRRGPRGLEAPAEDLERFLQSHQDMGLRWVGLVRPGGAPLAEAGTRVSGELGPPTPDPIEVGGIVRMQVPVGPPRPPPGSAPGGAGKAFGPGIGPPPPGVGDGPGHPLDLVIEFEPTMAAAVQDRARRDLGIGLIGAAGLLLVAAVVSALSVRAEQTEQRLVEQRHLAALGEMSAVLAHELKNPLASLKGHAQLLHEQLPEGRPRTKAQRVIDEAVRLQDLIGSLLAFVRSGRIERATTSPAALVHRVVERVEVRHAGASAPPQIEVLDDDAPPTWSMDETRLEQVVANLVDNAIEASAGGDPDHRVPVQITVEQVGAELRIAVRDHGPGIVPEIRDDLFAPFKTTKTRGVGLGLAVARRIVEAHGGRIAAEDVEGDGAQIAVTIPH